MEPIRASKKGSSTQHYPILSTNPQGRPSRCAKDLYTTPFCSPFYPFMFKTIQHTPNTPICGISSPRRGPSANGYEAWRFGSCGPIVSDAIVLGPFVCVWVSSIERRLDFFVISAGGSCHLGVLVWVCSSSCKDLARGSAGSKTPSVGTICGWSAAGRRYSADRGVWCVCMVLFRPLAYPCLGWAEVRLRS